MSWYDTNVKRDKKYKDLISLKIAVENTEDYNNTVKKSVIYLKKTKTNSKITLLK